MLCEGSQRVLEHPERIETLLDDARALAATDLFVQVYRGGRAWFDSSFADAAPYAKLKDATGIDTLARALAAAAALIEEGTLEEIVEARYADWDSELGREIREGKRSLEDLAGLVQAGGIDPQPRSGRQERLENLVNRVV